MYFTKLVSVLKHQQHIARPPTFTIRWQLRQKHTIDKSRIPVLRGEELEETFIKGGGPGGSNVNKTVSCVSLKHIPTGIVIKCQFSRLLHQNREIARERLVERLDELYNGDMSIKAQKQRIQQEKSIVAAQKSKNLSELKRRYKEHVRSTTGISSLSRSDSDQVEVD